MDYITENIKLHIAEEVNILKLLNEDIKKYCSFDSDEMYKQNNTDYTFAIKYNYNECIKRYHYWLDMYNLHMQEKEKEI